jgi:hypothetical protein
MEGRHSTVCQLYPHFIVGEISKRGPQTADRKPKSARRSHSGDNGLKSIFRVYAHELSNEMPQMACVVLPPCECRDHSKVTWQLLSGLPKMGVTFSAHTSTAWWSILASTRATFCNISYLHCTNAVRYTCVFVELSVSIPQNRHAVCFPWNINWVSIVIWINFTR